MCVCDTEQPCLLRQLKNNKSIKIRDVEDGEKDVTEEV